MKERSWTQEGLAEALGTFVLVLFTVGVVAQTALAPRLSPSGYDWNTIALGCGLAVALGIYVAGGVSRAHLNPAVTLALAVTGRFPWRGVLPYILGQMAGGFLGALAAYLVYREGLVAAGMPNVWCTGPGSVFGRAFWGAGPGGEALGTYSLASAFLSEVLGTALLLWGVLALTEGRLAPGANLAPLLIGLVVAAVGLSLGGPSGFALNPARDLAPRLLGALAGTEGLFQGPYWLGPPLLGSLLGGVLGAWTYGRLVLSVRGKA
jgi:glycerol uptake facilitator protein